MKRRRFLAALGTGILSLSAGCMFTSTPGQYQAGFPPGRTAGGDAETAQYRGAHCRRSGLE
jgi:hypothetical protein